jgi:hypothetical protein
MTKKLIVSGVLLSQMIVAPAFAISLGVIGSIITAPIRLLPVHIGPPNLGTPTNPENDPRSAAMEEQARREANEKAAREEAASRQAALKARQDALVKQQELEKAHAAEEARIAEERRLIQLEQERLSKELTSQQRLAAERIIEMRKPENLTITDSLELFRGEQDPQVKQDLAVMILILDPANQEASAYLRDECHWTSERILELQSNSNN